MKKRLWKKIGTLFLVMSLLVCYHVPLLAQGNTFHAWATEDLLEGDNCELYPLIWYDNMQKEISAEELEGLCKNIEVKLQAISGVTLKDQHLPFEYKGKGVITRKEVLESIYKLLDSYNYPGAIDLEQDVIGYMQKNGILSTGKDLKLDKKCTREEAAVFGARTVQVIYAKLQAGGKGFFWKIQKGNNTVYLLGAIHIANQGIYPFSTKISQAYQKADVLGVELNLYNQSGMADFYKIATYQDGTTLKEHISKALYDKTIEAAKKLGIGENDIKGYKPWCVANTFMTVVGSDASSLKEKQQSAVLGVDSYFTAKALTQNKPIYEFESYQYQGSLLDSFSDPLQEIYLSSAVDSVNQQGQTKTEKESSNSIDKWLKLWKDGDIQAFEEDYNKSIKLKDVDEAINDEYINKLFTQRNADMTKKVEEILNKQDGKTYFVTMGAGHFIGTDGVVAVLKSKGYDVEVVK